MRFFFPLWRWALPAATALALALTPGCKSSSSSSGTTETGTVTVSGKVTYTRIPLAFDANGVPRGLETDPAKFTSLPARGVLVRFYKSIQETAPDGSKATVWVAATSSDVVTGSDGTYSASVPKDTPVFVELASRGGGGSAGAGGLTQIIATGINSSLNISERPLYLLRKGLDGTSPEGNKTPGTAASANATVDFSVGLQDKWWLGPAPATLAAGTVNREINSVTRETEGTGSRVLAILDSIYSWASTYGRAVPEDGRSQNLHYRPGISEPRGSFVEYDKTVYPQSFDGYSLHYFGSLRGGADNDDAWDEGVLFPMLARNFTAHRWSIALLPVGARLTDLAPDLAVEEGFVDAMSANLLKSPYLADTAGAGATFRDIRDLSVFNAGQKSPYSAPAISALAWELILKANSLTSPGTSANWSSINPSAMVKFFSLNFPKATDTTTIIDSLSIYSQLARLSETKLAVDPVDLPALFPDSVLTPLLAPFGVPWPRPTTAPYSGFLQDWGSDPNTSSTAIAPIGFSMSKAVRVGGVFPNASQGELAYAKFSLTKDIAYAFGVQTEPATLPAGTSIEVFLPNAAKTFLFTGTTPAQRFPLNGNSTTPVLQWVRIRLISPQNVAPDVRVTIQLVPTT